MTPTTYIQRWKRINKSYEDKFTVKFNSALRSMVQDHIEGRPVTQTAINTTLRELYASVSRVWGAYIQSVLSADLRVQVKARLTMGFSERIVALMRQYYGADFFLNEAEGITETLRQAINDLLSRSAEEGLSNDEIVALLKSPDFTAMRARRIARTETVTAANGAAIAVAKDQGVPMNKIWLSVTDKRTRHTHALINGATVDIDTAFDLGGIFMQQPGVRRQPNGLEVPAAQVVNCRCVLGFAAKRDANGRLLR